MYQKRKGQTLKRLTSCFALADRSQLIENTWLVCAIRGGFALVVPFNC